MDRIVEGVTAAGYRDVGYGHEMYRCRYIRSCTSTLSRINK